LDPDQNLGRKPRNSSYEQTAHHCDPCDYTGGGTVIFEIEKIREPEPSTK